MAEPDTESAGSRPGCSVQIRLSDGREWTELGATELQDRILRLRRGLWHLAEIAVMSASTPPR